VENIRWAYKLASSTIHLQDQEDLKEIQIFRVKSRVEDLDVSILSFIDKLILTPIIFEVVYQDKVKVVATYKRLNQADKTKAVIGQYYASEWLEDHDRIELPLYLKLADLYEHFIAQILPITSSEDQETDECVSIELKCKAQQLESLQKQLDQLKSKLRNERQFNRKVELNKKVSELESQLAQVRRVNMLDKGIQELHKIQWIFLLIFQIKQKMHYNYQVIHRCNYC
jgi:hypothetical protein